MKIKKFKLKKEDLRFLLIDILALQEFAKRFWGNEVYLSGDFEGTTLYAWQYHLLRIITSRNPKKELEKQLNAR